MSLLERNQDCMSLMEKIISHVAADIHYGGGPRLQEIADELADKYPLVNAAPHLRDACKGFVGGWAHFCKCIDWNKTFLDADAIRWMNEVPNFIKAALATAEAKK